MSLHDVNPSNMPSDAIDDFERATRLDERSEDLLVLAKVLLSFVKRPRLATIQDGVGELVYGVQAGGFGDMIRDAEEMIAFIEMGNEQPSVSIGMAA